MTNQGFPTYLLSVLTVSGRHGDPSLVHLGFFWLELVVKLDLRPELKAVDI